MSYAVKEIFLTLQGEGTQAGRRAVFLRFAGCNLWTGRERDRATADCTFCDTDFVGTDGLNGGRYDAARRSPPRSMGLWAEGERASAFVVSPAASPCSSSTRPLIDALHARGFEVAVETNGTLPAPDGIDWLCVSPKAGTRGRPTVGRRAQAGLAAARHRSRRASRAGTSTIS